MRRKPAALHNIGIDRDARALGEFECVYPVELIHGCAHRFLSEYAFEGSELLYSDPPYEKELRKAKDMAIEEMSAEARTLGADAVVGVDLDYEHIGGGSKSMLMVTASGTAVNLE